MFVFRVLEAVGWFISAVIVADLGTGVMHWFEDTYLNTEVDTGITPLNDYFRVVAADNDRHHSDPQSMLQYNYLENLSTSAPPVLAISGLVFGGYQLSVVSDVWWWAVAICLGGSGNLVHRFAHSPGPWWIQRLQKLGVVQSIQDHKRHHYTTENKKTSKQDVLTDYCVLTTFMNPILDGLGVWRRIEQIIETLLGVKANHAKPA